MLEVRRVHGSSGGDCANEEIEDRYVFSVCQFFVEVLCVLLNNFLLVVLILNSIN